MIFGTECQWCDAPLAYVEGKDLAHGGVARQLCPSCGGRNQVGPLKEHPQGPLTLDQARKRGRFHVVVVFDSGGMVPFTAPASQVACTQDDLIELSLRLNRFTMGADSGWSVGFRKYSKPEGVWGGTNGGWMGERIWVHQQLTLCGLSRAIEEVLHATRRPEKVFEGPVAVASKRLASGSTKAGALMEAVGLQLYAYGFSTYARTTEPHDEENGYPVYAMTGGSGRSIDGFCAADLTTLRGCIRVFVEVDGSDSRQRDSQRLLAVFTTVPASAINKPLAAKARKNRVSVVTREALRRMPVLTGDPRAREFTLDALRPGLVTRLWPSKARVPWSALVEEAKRKGPPPRKAQRRAKGTTGRVQKPAD